MLLVWLKSRSLGFKEIYARGKTYHQTKVLSGPRSSSLEPWGFRDSLNIALMNWTRGLFLWFHFITLYKKKQRQSKGPSSHLVDSILAVHFFISVLKLHWKSFINLIKFLREYSSLTLFLNSFHIYQKYLFHKTLKAIKQSQILPNIKLVV